MDPSTEAGCVNVRFADRTYAKLKDLKLFTTAIASAQAALSEASATSITNLETTLQLLETDLTYLQQSIQTDVYDTRNKLEDALVTANSLLSRVSQIDNNQALLSKSIEDLSNALTALNGEYQSFKQATQTSISDFNVRLSGVSLTVTSLESRVSDIEDYILQSVTPPSPPV